MGGSDHDCELTLTECSSLSGSGLSGQIHTLSWGLGLIARTPVGDPVVNLGCGPTRGLACASAGTRLYGHLASFEIAIRSALTGQLSSEALQRRSPQPNR